MVGAEVKRRAGKTRGSGGLPPKIEPRSSHDLGMRIFDCISNFDLSARLRIQRASLREGGGPLAVEGASDNITISIVKNSNCVERKKLNQLRIFCDFYLDAFAGSFHHFVVPLPPGGRLVTLGDPP